MNMLNTVLLLHHCSFCFTFSRLQTLSHSFQYSGLGLAKDIHLHYLRLRN